MSGVKFRFQLYRCLAVLTLVGVTSIYLNGTRVLLPENSAYLSDYRFNGENSIHTSLFGGRERWGSMDGFTALTNEYDARKNYGLLDPYSESRYNHSFARLANDALSDFFKFHTDTLKANAKTGFDRAIDLDQLRASRSPLLLVGVAAAIYSGRTLRYRLGSDFAFESKTTMQESRFNRQYLGWVSSQLGASAGGKYDATDRSMGFSAHKNISSNVRMDYERTTDHSVGVSYSTAF